MNKLLYLFTFFAISVNAQIVHLKIADIADNLPLDDADVYFKNSTKNFVSDLEGNAVVDLNTILPTDELIISKKDYQDANIKVSDIKTDLTIKLEKVSKVELKEAFVTNLKAEDILKKVIDNYDKNFNSEKYFFLVKFLQEATYDSLYFDMLDVDLQFKFRKDEFKIKSKETPNKIIDSDYQYKINTALKNYIGSINIKNKLVDVLEKLSTQHYNHRKIMVSKYSDKMIYEITLEANDVNVKIFVDKDSYAIVEFFSDGKNYKTKDNINVIYSSVNYKYRLHKGFWVLKESEALRNITFKNYIGDDILVNKIFKIKVLDYSSKLFPEYPKNININFDIRKSFK